MSSVDLNGLKFTALSNSSNGEVAQGTVFEYNQQEDLIFARYAGGQIRQGFLVGTRSGDNLTFSYQHVNLDNEILTGQCQSTIQVNADGLVELHEHWQWTCRDHSKGQSVLRELRAGGWELGTGN